MDTAITEYSKADNYAQNECRHEIIKVNIKAAKETLALEKAGTISRDQASETYWKRSSQYWILDPCNRP